MPTNGIGRFLVFVRQSDSYRAVGWLDTVLVLVLGSENDFLVSYDVTALFTNVPLEETIRILAKKAFNGNWFNNTHNLNICEGDLIELLTIATKDKLFQFNGDLY